jgi:hypothetical protein
MAICGLFFFSSNASAQLRDYLNLPDHDDKTYNLGIGILYNTSHFQISAHPHFLQNDSILSVNSQNNGGFGLAGMHTFRLSDRFEARIIFPQLIFISNSLTYTLKNPAPGEYPVEVKQIPSVLLGLPIQLKFRSDRIGNFRVYMMGGINPEYDLASNATARKAEDLVKLQPLNLSVEAGMGFQFFFPYFILSPEIKISDGLKNIHSRDPSLKFSNVIDKLNSRMIVFSLIFEG